MSHKTKYTELQDTWGSDHYLIDILIGETIKWYKKKSNMLSNDKTNRNLYKELLQNEEEEIMQETLTEENWEEKYKKLIETLKDAVIEQAAKQHFRIGRKGK